MNGTVTTNVNMVTASSYADRLHWDGSGYTSQDNYLDNVIVRKFVSTEPSFSSADAEETETPATGIVPKVKLSGTFADKTLKVKIGGTFVEKNYKVKVGGIFI